MEVASWIKRSGETKECCRDSLRDVYYLLISLTAVAVIPIEIIEELSYVFDVR